MTQHGVCFSRGCLTIHENTAVIAFESFLDDRSGHLVIDDRGIGFGPKAAIIAEQVRILQVLKAPLEFPVAERRIEGELV